MAVGAYGGMKILVKGLFLTNLSLPLEWPSLLAKPLLQMVPFVKN